MHVIMDCTLWLSITVRSLHTRLSDYSLLIKIKCVFFLQFSCFCCQLKLFTLQVLFGRPFGGSGRCRPVNGTRRSTAGVCGPRRRAIATARPATAVRVQTVAIASRHARVRSGGYATGIPATTAGQPDNKCTDQPGQDERLHPSTCPITDGRG